MGLGVYQADFVDWFVVDFGGGLGWFVACGVFVFRFSGDLICGLVAQFRVGVCAWFLVLVVGFWVLTCLALMWIWCLRFRYLLIRCC